MKPFKRSERVAPLIQQEISRILLMDIKDPRVQSVTVTDIQLTADLREAKVFVSCLADQIEREEMLKALKRATGYIRGELGKRLKLKFIPHIAFLFDDSYEKQERILSLLEHIQAEALQADEEEK